MNHFPLESAIQQLASYHLQKNINNCLTWYCSNVAYDNMSDAGSEEPEEQGPNLGVSRMHKQVVMDLLLSVSDVRRGEE